MIHRCHDCIWSFLHSIILNIPPARLVLFPSLAGSVWFLTLASLLLTWFARGMRPYPGQSNPHVPFISDIASFELKPLFLVGASITAMGFFFTVAAVHVMRYEPGFALIRCPENYPSPLPTPPISCLSDETTEQSNSPTTLPNNYSDIHDRNSEAHQEEEEEEEEGEDPETLKTLKFISLSAIFAAGMASVSLILLSVMDTFRYKFAHHIFLRLCFAGLAIQSAGTAIVYADEVLGAVSYIYHLGRWQHVHMWGKRSLQLRIFATLSTLLILIEVFLGVAFISLTVDDETSDYRTAGILEWIIAFLGTIYLWLFCGFFDRSDFKGYVPSIIYHHHNQYPHGTSLSLPPPPPAFQPRAILIHPSTPDEERRGGGQRGLLYSYGQDPERQPLLRHDDNNGDRNMDRKYI